MLWTSYKFVLSPLVSELKYRGACRRSLTIKIYIIQENWVHNIVRNLKTRLYTISVNIFLVLFYTFCVIVNIWQIKTEIQKKNITWMRRKMKDYTIYNLKYFCTVVCIWKNIYYTFLLAKEYQCRYRIDRYICILFVTE